jgi:serine/threonine protein kinase
MRPVKIFLIQFSLLSLLLTSTPFPSHADSADMCHTHRQFDDWIGREIPKGFFIKRILGQGAFGVVFEAAPETWHEPRVVVKIPLSDDPKVIQAFASEVTATLRLSAYDDAPTSLPRILGYTLGDSAKDTHIITKFYPGQTITEIVSKGERLTLKDLLIIFTKIIEGLKFSHLKNIVHGDLRPSNVMIKKDANGKVIDAMVIDFGLADLMHIINDAGKSSTVDRSHSVTSHDSRPLLSKMDLLRDKFRAPEQVGDDARSEDKTDVYQLGILARMLIFGEASGIQLSGLNRRSFQALDILSTTLDGMTHKDPNKRLNLGEVENDLLRAQELLQSGVLAHVLNQGFVKFRNLTSTYQQRTQNILNRRVLLGTTALSLLGYLIINMLLAPLFLEEDQETALEHYRTNFDRYKKDRKAMTVSVDGNVFILDRISNSVYISEYNGNGRKPTYDLFYSPYWRSKDFIKQIELTPDGLFVIELNYKMTDSLFRKVVRYYYDPYSLKFMKQTSTAISRNDYKRWETLN